MTTGTTSLSLKSSIPHAAAKERFVEESIPALRASEGQPQGLRGEALDGVPARGGLSSERDDRNPIKRRVVQTGMNAASPKANRAPPGKGSDSKEPSLAEFLDQFPLEALEAALQVLRRQSSLDARNPGH